MPRLARIKSFGFGIKQPEMPSCVFWLGGVRHGDVEATHTHCLIAEAFAFEAQCEEGKNMKGPM